jgi:hypothetical protein
MFWEVEEPTANELGVPIVDPNIAGGSIESRALSDKGEGCVGDTGVVTPPKRCIRKRRQQNTTSVHGYSTHRAPIRF